MTIDDRLAGALDQDTLEAILRDAGDPQRPVLVGHDPDFSELLDDLTGSSGLEMKKGAIARIDIERPLAAGTGTLGLAGHARPAQAGTLAAANPRASSPDRD